MKKVAEVLTIGVLIFICMGLLVGCEVNKNFVVSYEKLGSFGIKDTADGELTFTLEMVDSLQALKDLCADWDNPAFEENSERYTSELSRTIRSYNEVFFNERILVIYAFDRGHRKKTQIDSIEVDGSMLIINTRLITQKGTFTDEAFSWLMLIEVNKSDVMGATTIQVKQK